MTPDELEQAAIEMSGEIAFKLSRVFLDGIRQCSEELLQTHLLQMTNTVWATAVSIAISDICKAIRLDEEESLRAHQEIIDDICKSAKKGYRTMKEKQFH